MWDDTHDDYGNEVVRGPKDTRKDTVFEKKPLGFSIHGIPNMGPGNTLDKSYLKYPDGDVRKELGGISYEHDVAYMEASRLKGLDRINAIKAADKKMLEEIKSIRTIFGSFRTWQDMLGYVPIKIKMHIEDALRPLGYSLYNGEKWFAPISVGGKKKRLR